MREATRALGDQIVRWTMPEILRVVAALRAEQRIIAAVERVTRVHGERVVVKVEVWRLPGE